MKQFLFVPILISYFSTAYSQLIETTSTITVEHNFKHVEENEHYFLIPQFSSPCFVAGMKYPYNYYRGEKEVKIPYIMWSQVAPPSEKTSFSNIKTDSLFTIYHASSNSTIFYQLKFDKAKNSIIYLFHNVKNQICYSKAFSMDIISRVDMEYYVRNKFPPYDIYTRIVLHKK